MSHILEALRMAEQELKRESVREDRVTKPPAAEPLAGSPAWRVEMVSPVRFIRYRARAAERTEEAAVSSLPKGLIIAVTLLGLVAFFIFAIAYDVRGRMRAVTSEVKEVTRQVNQAKTQMARLDAERRRLDMENSSLRQENEAAGAELERARIALEKLRVRRRATMTQSRPPIAVQKVGPLVPPAAAPSPITDRRSRVEQQPAAWRQPALDTIETRDFKVYAIR